MSRILGHARVTITLDVYIHLFDEARHADEIRADGPERIRAAAGHGHLGVAAPAARRVAGWARHLTDLDYAPPATNRSAGSRGNRPATSDFDGASRTRTGDLLGAIRRSGPFRRILADIAGLPPDPGTLGAECLNLRRRLGAQRHDDLAERLGRRSSWNLAVTAAPSRPRAS